VVTKRVTRREAAENFDALVGTVTRTKEPIEVEDQGRVVAVVLSPEAFAQWERRAFFAMLEEIREANADKEPEEVLDDVTRVVEEVRRERHERRRA
jgi:PHD/YefM family antitoxin component YafN of YafNO toxin-antitoxin module